MARRTAELMPNARVEAHYAELFAGPGVLINEETGEEVPGSPLEALGIGRPFDGYVFADADADCTHALDARVGP